MRPCEFVREYSIKSLVCCFSGGKDSLVATHYVLRELQDVEDLHRYVVLVDTTVMIPLAIDFVKDVSAQFGWNLKVLQPNTSFWNYASRYGFPRAHYRWCCYRLKLQPIFDFVKTLPFQRGEVTGLRKDESLRRSKLRIRQVSYDKRRGVKAWLYHPILNWSEKQVLAYMKKHGLPMPPHYRLGLKETCYCGAFCSMKEARILRGLFPEMLEKFAELEEKRAKYKSAAFFTNKPIYAKDLLKQKTLEESFQ